MHDIKRKAIELLKNFSKSWKQLLATHVLYTLLAVAILTPLITISINLLVELSGNAALSDQDILFFALSPVGFIAMVLAIALIVTAVALEYAALMTVAYTAIYGQTITYGRALAFAMRRGLTVIKLSARMLGRLLLYMFPFLGMIALIYAFFLSKFDINYYLSVKPPSFWIALLLAGVVMAGMLVVLVRVFVSWFFAFPLLLFRNAEPKTALAVSKQETSGKRKSITIQVCVWLAVSLGITGLTAGFITLAGAIIVPHVAQSIRSLSFVLGGLMLIGSIINFAVLFFNVSMLSLLMVDLYRSAGLGSGTEAAALREKIGESRRLKLAITGRLILAAGIIAAGIATFFSYQLITSLCLEDHAQIFAHRGASATAPENTMAAIRSAIAEGTDWVEIDVQETADGEVVVIHDSDLKKIGGVDMKVWDTPYEELETHTKNWKPSILAPGSDRNSKTKEFPHCDRYWKPAKAIAAWISS